MNRPKTFLRSATAALALATVAVLTTTPAVEAAPALPGGFRSVGYMPSWSGNVNNIQYSKLTHINYAFALPNSNGSLQAIPDPNKLRSLVSLGHQNGVKVSLAIGGWNGGNDSAFEALAGNSSGRTTFVNAVMSTVNNYGLDGVDIDWEYPDPGTSGDNFTALMRQLSSALHGAGKLLTAAVVSEGNTANGVQPAVFGLVDWLNIMAYDGGSPHANYDWSINAVNFWKGRGLPASKAVLGVPFYSRPGYLTYAQLVAMDPANANRDCVNANGAQQCYNGIPTIKRKTQWAMANAAGIMNWELSQDTTGSTSLVSAIYETATGDTPPPSGGGQITGIGGKCVDVAGANTANGTAIQLWTCNGTNAQQWTVQGSTIRALGKCMDVGSERSLRSEPSDTGRPRAAARSLRGAVRAATANGTVVQLWDCNGSGAQNWQAQSNGTLRNPASGRCLDATGPSSADGTRLQIWDCFGGSNQVWHLP